MIVGGERGNAFHARARAIDLNATPLASGSSSGGPRKLAREMSANMLSGARNLFDGMPAAVDEERANRFMQSIIFDGVVTAASGVATAGYDREETQSKDGRGTFTQDEVTFMQDQVGVDLDGYPLDHVFPNDYDLEEEDEVDIDGEPLVEDELANQAAGEQSKRKSRRTKAYTTVENNLICIPSFGGIQGPTGRKVLQPFSLLEDHQRLGEIEAPICSPRRAWGEEPVDKAGEGEKPRPRGKTNSKKEDKPNVASIALIATVEGMMSKKDSREEKRRQDKEVQMNAFMEIQRRRLDMEVGKQDRMLEMEAEKPGCLRSRPPMPRPRRKKCLSLA
ncbi:DNA repair protein rhp54 [Hordeum vulgare]|nr:DNA repair protein rhp54 [Hordeum vulgare]